MDLILVAVISLGAIGLISAVILYAASKKFAVYEDPRIGQVAEVLPQANCGGCGYPGCSGFAAACVKAGSLEGKLCPVGGQPTMEKVAAILGLEATASEPKVAVVRCNGTCANRPRITTYNGVRSCAIAHATYGGETGCSFGCLGCGDCVSACQFDAIHINPETGLPEVDENKCTACGACSKACPRNIIEIRPKGKNNRRVVVMCVNKDKGAVANKACSASCIGCGVCLTVEEHPVYIHQHHAAEIEEVEFQRAPLPLHGGAQGVIAQKRDEHKENVAVHQGQRIGNEPPDLPPENIGPAEAQQIVEDGVPCKHGDEIHHGVAQSDIEHQVGNALIAVGKAIPLEVTAQIFQ